MSREIKFRCWNAFSNHMHDWDEMVEKNKIHLLSNENKSYVCEQYTGLKDKNGVEIYDGDVCEIMYYTPFGDKTDDFYGEWQVKKWMGQFILISRKERLSFTDFADVKSSEYVSNLGTVVELSDVVNVMVIGNIHQNPELLK